MGEGKSDATTTISLDELSLLRERSAAFNALFQQSPIGIAYHRIVTDAAGTPVNYYFLDANEHYLTLTGVDPRGRLVTDAFPGIEKDPFDWIATFGRVALSGESIRFQQYLEATDRWYDCVGYQSGPGHFVAAFLEITEGKRKEAELQRYRDHLEDLVNERTRELSAAKDAAEQANRAKSAFLANMSHELRTPLNAVLGYAEILFGRESDVTNRRYLDAIRASGTALLGLINDILDLARIEAGRLRVETRSVRLRTIIEETIAIFAGRAHEKDIELSASVAAEVPELVETDAVRLRQVLLNLVGNAVKFTTDGHVRIDCRATRGSRSRADVTIAVSDSGPGIHEADRDRIFEAFAQADDQKPSDFDGVGLGLAITRSIVEAMGGTIGVESEVGRGSRFTVLFPSMVVLTESASGDDPPRATAAIAFEPARVLIVDDVAYNRDLFAAFLAEQPLEVDVAESGPRALELCRESPPDLILLDYKMPGMDGVEVIRALKASPATASIPVIVVTASALARDIESISSVADRLLRKPVARSELLSTMAGLLASNSLAPDAGDESDLLRSCIEPELIEELYHLALDGNLKRLVDTIGRIPTRDDPVAARFVARVESLATSYRDEQIITFLRGCLDERGD